MFLGRVAGVAVQLLLGLGLLVALGLAEGAAAAPVDSPWTRGLAVLAVALSTPLLALLIAAVTVERLHRRPADGEIILSRYDRLRYIHLAWWLLAVALSTAPLGWARLVRHNLGLDGLVLIDECLILAVAVLPWALSLVAAFEVERAAERLSWRGEWSGAFPPRGAARRRFLDVHLRQQLALVLVPLLGMLVVQDLVRLCRPAWLVDQNAWLLLLAPLAALLVGFPLLIRWLWQTEPLPPGPLRTRLEALNRRTGFRPRDILVWRTDGRVVNAAVSGVAPQLRYVLLSDGLLALLDDDDIEAVYAHEVGHVRRHHLPLRALLMIAPVWGWLLALRMFPGLQEWSVTDWAPAGVGGPAFAALAATLAVAAYVAVVFGFIARRLERQADLFGCLALAGDGGPPVLGQLRFAQAMRNLAAANGLDPDRPSWQHDSITCRLGFLRHATADPALARRFERRLAWLSAGVTALCVAGVALEIVRLLGTAGNFRLIGLV